MAGAALLTGALAAYLSWTLNLWVDEGFTLDTTARGPAYAWRQALGFEAQAPAYFVLLSLWRLVAPSPLAARLLSVLAAALTVPLMARLARGYLGPRAAPGWVALGVCAHPLLLYSASELRCYALAMALAGALLWAFLRLHLAPGEDRPTWRLRLLHVALAALGLYTQYYIGFLLVGNFVALLAALAARRRSPWRPAAAYLLEMALVGLLILPLVLQVLGQVGTYGGISWELPLPEALKHTYWRALDLLLPAPEGAALARKWLLRGLLLAALAGLLLGRRWRDLLEPRLLALLVSSTTVLLFGLALQWRLGEEMFALRHTSFLLPPLLLAGFGVAGAALGPRARGGAPLALLLLGLAALAAAERYQPLAKPGDWARVAAHLRTAEGPGQPILLYKATAVLAFRAHYQGQNRIVPLPGEPDLRRWDPAGDVIKDPAAMGRKLQQLRRPGGRFWLVMDGSRRYAGITYSHPLLERAVLRRGEVLQRRRFHKSEVWLLRWR